MKTFIGFLKSAGIIYLLLTAHIGHTQQWEWARDLYFSYNYGYYDAWYPLPNAIDYDHNGITYVTGYVSLLIEDQVNVDKKFLFLSKFDAQGNLVWKKMYGGSPSAPSSGGNGSDIRNGITLDTQGNILVTGSVDGWLNFGNISSNSPSQDLFLAKYDAAGIPVWVKRASTSTGWSKGFGISYDHTGNIWVLGSFKDNITLDNATLTATNNLNDLLVAKFAAAGNLLWAKRISGSNSVEAGGISTDLSGNAVVTGTFTHKEVGEGKMFWK